MTALLAPRESGSAFLHLPAETRLQIYNYLLPRSRLDINLCDLEDSQTTSLELPSTKPKDRKCSPISTMVSQNLAIETIIRANGLQLLPVSTHTAAEVTALLSEVPVRFHCPKCFDQWLRNMSYGFGVGIKWLKRVDIIFEVETEPRIFGPSLQNMTPALSKFMVHEMTKQCQRTAYAYFGRLDVTDPPREKWEYEVFKGEKPPLWEGHPNYPDGRTPEHFSQAMFHAREHGGLHEHPWVMNGGFPAPGMGLPVFHGVKMTSQSLTTGLAQVVPRMPLDRIDLEYGPGTRCWLIKARFDNWKG